MGAMSFVNVAVWAAAAPANIRETPSAVTYLNSFFIVTLSFTCRTVGILIPGRGVCQWTRLPLRPQCALVLFRHGSETFVDELLHTLAAVGFGGVYVAFRIGGDAVHGVELAGLASAVAEAGEHLKRFAVQDVDLLVRAVGQIKVLLLRIF